MPTLSSYSFRSLHFPLDMEGIKAMITQALKSTLDHRSLGSKFLQLDYSCSPCIANLKESLLPHALSFFYANLKYLALLGTRTYLSSRPNHNQNHANPKHLAPALSLAPALTTA